MAYNWRNKWLTADANDIDQMISALRAAAHQLEAMKADGIVLDLDASSMEDDYALLVAPDKAVARKHFGYTVIENLAVVEANAGVAT